MFDQFREFTLAFDEAVHLVVVHGLHELHRDVVVFLQDVHDILNAFLDHLDDGLLRIHLRLLREISHAVARGPDHLALVGFLHAGDDLQEGGLSRPVQADDADFRPVEEGKVDVLEDDFVVVGEDFPHPVHREYDLFVCHGVLFAVFAKISKKTV